MVGAINPNGTQTLDAQIRAARGAEIRIAPGEPIPNEGASSVPHGYPAAATSSPSHTSTQRHSSKISGEAIAGIVIGGVVSLVVCVAVLIWMIRGRPTKAAGESREKVSTASQVPEFKYAPQQQMISPVSPYSATASFDGHVPCPLRLSVVHLRRLVFYRF
jgi:hypothetical protein